MTAKEHFSTSQLYMWRCILAMCWADHEFGREEIEYFRKVFDNLARYYNLSQEQRNTLADELETPRKGSIEELFAHINDPVERQNVLVFAYEAAMLDGVVSPEEEDILKRLQMLAPVSYDREKLRAELRDMRAAQKEQLKAEMQAIRAGIHADNRYPWFPLVDRLLLRLGIDVLQ